jgi:hypothetical protein
VNEQPDPERLLAEALRAQAVRAPMPAQGTPSPNADAMLPLLSGPDAQPAILAVPSLPTTQNSQDTPATTGIERPTEITDPRYTARLSRAAPLSVGWIVVLALLLGLAAGAVVGLVSVI